MGTPSDWCTWMYHAMKCNERRSPFFRWIKWTSTGEFGYFWLWVKHDDFHSAVVITFKKKLLGRLGSNLYCKYVLVENILRTAPMINVIGYIILLPTKLICSKRRLPEAGSRHVTWIAQKWDGELEILPPCFAGALGTASCSSLLFSV